MSQPPPLPRPPHTEDRVAPSSARRRSSTLYGRWASFRAALDGVGHVVRTQPNAWIELSAAVVVAVAGWWLRIRPLEWALLGLTVAAVLALEAVNSAIEAVVDLASPHHQPLAKVAKDCAAGALVFAVLGSLVVAAAIFGPRLWAWYFGGS